MFSVYNCVWRVQALAGISVSKYMVQWVLAVPISMDAGLGLVYFQLQHVHMATPQNVFSGVIVKMQVKCVTRTVESVSQAVRTVHQQNKASGGQDQDAE